MVTGSSITVMSWIWTTGKRWYEWLFRTGIISARLIWAAAVPLIAWAFGIAFLALPPQTGDLLTQATIPQLVLFHAAVALWGLTCWFWARWSLNLQPVRLPETLRGQKAEATGVPDSRLALTDDVEQPGRFLRAYIARLPLISAPFAALIPVLRSFDDYERIVINFLLFALVDGALAVAVIRRTKWPAVFRRDQTNPLLAKPISWTGRVPFKECLARLPFGKFSFLVWTGGFAAFVLLVWQHPVAVPVFLGAPAAAFLALSLATGMIAFASVMIRRLSGVPGLPVILIWAFFIAQLSNNHTIRTIDPNGLAGPVRFDNVDEKVTGRRHLRVAIEDWANACKRKAADKDGKGAPSTIVLVATAGGASRAALWTASVLHQAEEAVGAQGFRKALFGISGVSGGSLGAATYIASLPPDGCDAAPDIAGDKARWQRTRLALSENFLAPPVTAYLSTDLFARILPFELSDRAAALEQSWEVAFKTAWATPLQGPKDHDIQHAGGLEEPFLNIWPQPGDPAGVRLPFLFLNGTHANTGLPIMTSPVTVTRDQFPLALDLLDITGRDVRLSTAVLNSARFPIVTPGGTLMDRHKDGTGYGGYVMDGGYVENFGADTVRDVAADLAAWSRTIPEGEAAPCAGDPDQQ